jgi:hypothetical protein
MKIALATLALLAVMVTAQVAGAYTSCTTTCYGNTCTTTCF